MNYEVWIENTIENEHLKLALQFRIKRNFPEALYHLNLACDEGDGKALFFKYRAYLYGGWTLYRDIDESEKYYKRAVIAGCPWCRHSEKKDNYGWGLFYLMRTRTSSIYKVTDAIPSFEKAYKEEGNPLAVCELFWLVQSKEYSNALMHAVGFGDEYTQLVLSRHIQLRIRNENITSKPFLIKAAEAKHQDALSDLASRYYDDNRFLECAYLLMEARCYSESLTIRLRSTTDLRELFIYGRGLTLRQYVYKLPDKKSIERAMIIYQTSVHRTKAAVFCFTIVFRKCNLLSKDLRRMVGEIIWKSIKNPAVWGVK